MRLALLFALVCSLRAQPLAIANVQVHCPTTPDMVVLVNWTFAQPVFVRDEPNPDGHTTDPHQFPVPGFTFDKNQRGPVTNSTTFTITPGPWLVYFFVQSPSYRQSLAVPFTCAAPVVAPPTPAPQSGDLIFGSGLVTVTVEGKKTVIVDGTVIEFRVGVPATMNSPCTRPQYALSPDKLWRYECVAPNEWRRIALSTW